MMIRMPHTGAVTAWSEPTTQEKGALLSSIYEMAGIRPPSESVEKWIIGGWSHACDGLTTEQVYEAFVMCMAGRLEDADGRRVTLELYGKEFSLMVFSNVLQAYRGYLYRKRQELLERQAEERRRAEEERRTRITPEQDLENKRYLARKAYREPDAYDDWGGVTYRRLEALGLLAEIADARQTIAERAAVRVAEERDEASLMRMAADPDFRRKVKNKIPDTQGEAVRHWFRTQKEKGLSEDDVLKKLKLK